MPYVHFRVTVLNLPILFALPLAPCLSISNRFKHILLYETIITEHKIKIYPMSKVSYLVIKNISILNILKLFLFKEYNRKRGRININMRSLKHWIKWFLPLTFWCHLIMNHLCAALKHPTDDVTKVLTWQTFDIVSTWWWII